MIPKIQWTLPPKAPKFSRREIHVWRISRSHPLCLTPEEEERSGKFKHQHAREQYAHSRSALRAIGALYTGENPLDLIVKCREHGKPFFEGKDIFFNTSHSGDLMVIAFSRGAEIGIDIENGSRVRNHLALAKRYFSAEEQELLNSAGDESRIREMFLRFWVCKEATLKSSGHGLSGGLQKTRIVLTESPVIAHRGADDRKFPVTEFIPGEKFCGALVSEDSVGGIKWFVR